MVRLMIGVYFICFLLFPYLVISSIQFTKQDKENVIEKNDAVILRGIAAILVILAHYTNSFSNWGGIKTVPFLRRYWSFDIFLLIWIWNILFKCRFRSQYKFFVEKV